MSTGPRPQLNVGSVVFPIDVLDSQGPSRGRPAIWERTMDCERLQRELDACRREISQLRTERDEWRDEALLLDRLLSDRRALIDARIPSALSIG